MYGGSEKMRLGWVEAHNSSHGGGEKWIKGRLADKSYCYNKTYDFQLLSFKNWFLVSF